MTKINALSALGLAFLFALGSSARAGDGYTFPVTPPDQRFDGKGYLAGPENWVATKAPVEPQLKGTRPITEKLFSKTMPDGSVHERWQACVDACGPGCSLDGKHLMGGCEKTNDKEHPAKGVWLATDGTQVTCDYEVWACRTHEGCRTHDACLLACSIKSDSAGGNAGGDERGMCKTKCNAAVAWHPCAGGWGLGAPADGCFDGDVIFSRAVLGSCVESH